MSDVVIRAEGLGKKYIIGHETQRESYTALRDVIARGAQNFLRKARDMVHGRPIIEGDELEEVWALRDVSFEIRRGEVVGIIGRNGAGKSTLLKILSRITDPSEGRVSIKGRVASLLEVGTGFHPELTGRENVFLNGAILGMARAEIKGKFDEIVAFAEVEKFIDTPVKRYSSGMYVRLAFAVAAHLDPEILIVDEVLAVGDIAFQKKCLGRMSKVAKEGRTVLFVSHNMEAIRKLCSRGLLLEGGRILLEGGADKVISRYIQTDTSLRTSFQIPSPDEGSGSAVATELAIENITCSRQNGFPVGTPWQVRVLFRIEHPTEHFIAGIGLVSERSIAVWTVWSKPRDIEPGCYEAVFRNDQVHLAAGTYSIIVGLSSYQRALHYVEEAGRLVLSEVSENSDALDVSGGSGIVLNPMSIVITRC